MSKNLRRNVLKEYCNQLQKKSKKETKNLSVYNSINYSKKLHRRVFKNFKTFLYFP